ncbi:glycosyltransferase [Kineosporia sp. J2-2]|uniref:Glycosyltransferase n=1 Tax=Kineosporia corallincola TaxID=2835133 RepID=A0ABS5THH2_9ACTN|nr:glycosyltransferase [Kineosporia corallincola]MBT0769631.1 glycosyltransferase [Kineosporia corallincola]
MTSFVQGDHTYLIPVLPGRGPDGRGRARTWDWPPNAREVTPAELAGLPIDLVVLQRPHELKLTREWTGRRPGTDVPAVYVEHNTPSGPAVSSMHPLAGHDDVPLVHVTRFNEMAWDNGLAPTRVVEHGIVDPGYLYTGDDASVAVVVNEPVRRARVAGTDLVARVAAEVPVDVYGMGVEQLPDHIPDVKGRVHEDVPQAELHRMLGRHRLYLHPYRWTSLGLSLIEAMTLGMPVLALATTEAPVAVPPGAGVVSNDLRVLTATARRWLADPQEAREIGLTARQYALSRYGLDRSLADWDAIVKEMLR